MNEHVRISQENFLKHFGYFPEIPSDFAFDFDEEEYANFLNHCVESDFDYLKDLNEGISGGFCAPMCSVAVCIPECNVCIYRDGPGKCKKCGIPSDDFSYGERHDCPDAILNISSFLYPKYQKLYPEECERCKKEALQNR